MDNKTTITVGAIAGSVYAAQMILAPSMYLDMDGQKSNSDNTALCRAVGGGIAGLTTAAVLASRSESNEVQMVSIKAMCTAMSVWSVNNVMRVMDRGSFQSKIDTTTCCVLGGLFFAALFALYSFLFVSCSEKVLTNFVYSVGNKKEFAGKLAAYTCQCSTQVIFAIMVASQPSCSILNFQLTLSSGNSN